ncbi:hypothetical protein FM106_17750 [Brachybacterium faecium]|nr:hypothetical protein FM106_17750 [Brachybacterium faecium]
MEQEIQLISDGEGVAVIGDPTAVDLFLSSAGVPSRELPLGRVGGMVQDGTAARASSATLEVSSQAAAHAGRWVKLTEKSAAALDLGTVMKGSSEGVSRAIVTDNGRISSILEFVRTPASVATNPALLAGAAGVMAQVAMQQTMQEITDYLESIDEKVEDVLRAQKDAALSELIGAGFVIDRATSIWESMGRVPQTTWDSVYTTAGTIASAQAYALRRLDAIAVKLENKTALRDIARIAKESEPEIREWLAVLARTFQLLDAKDVLELERVLETEPHEIDRHRLALRTARQKRLEKIAAHTAKLLDRADASVAIANAKVLFQPAAAKTVVRSSNLVIDNVTEFRGRLKIDGDHANLEGRRWSEAAGDVRDGLQENAKHVAQGGVDTARQLSAGAARRAGAVRSGIAGKIRSRRLRRKSNSAGAEAPLRENGQDQT